LGSGGYDTSKTALRLGIGRYTVDIVSRDNGLCAIIGSGVGSEPTTVPITPTAVVALLDRADTIDDRRPIGTQAWPLLI
jgi:hypothetical protein